MIKLKFKCREDEIRYFLLIKAISEYTGVHVRYAECISDLDEKAKETYFCEDD